MASRPFSRRTPDAFTPNRLHRALTRRHDVIDLMTSNPTRCAFTYSDLQVPLVGAAAPAYCPDAFGLRTARAALASYLTERGQVASAEHLVLTASTSEAYGILFKLLCDPGDAVAVAAPNYPLVTHLAELEGVRPVAYRLDPDTFELDLASLTAAVVAGARAVVLITPHNPTGSCLSVAEAEAVGALCRAHGVVVIVDEVFAPYGGQAPALQALRRAAPLSFVLRGVSKEVGLPQLKLAWMHVCGDPDQRRDALARLEWICDAYLSASTAVQAALPELLALAPEMQAQIGARVAENRAALPGLLAPLPMLDVLPACAGWYAVVRLPQHLDEEEVVVALAERAGVALHPGYFYDFSCRKYLVCALLLQPALFATAWQRALSVLHACLA